MDHKLLADLGLSNAEAALYMAVVKTGAIAPAALAKAAGVKRTTAYSIARSLVEKGILTEDATHRPRSFVPASPEQVLSLIDGEKRRLKDRENIYKNLANELSNVSAEKSYPVPTVRFIEEGKLMDFLHSQAPVWDKSILESGEPTWWGFQDHTFVEQYGSWINWYWNQAPEDIDLKLLSNRAEAEVKFAQTVTPRRVIKFWGEATDFLSTTWAIGDYLIMINTRQKPFYLVEIHDKLMAHDQREVFKNLWPLV